jgi:hypothetical protein
MTLDPLKEHPIQALHDRFSKKVEQGRSIQLSPQDLDLLVISGAYAALLQYVADDAFARSKQRLEAKGMDLGALQPPSMVRPRVMREKGKPST